VAQNDEQAASWIRRAAEQDDLQAQYALGLAYASGIGTHYDYSRADQLLKEAEENGISVASEQRSLHAEEHTARDP